MTSRVSLLVGLLVLLAPLGLAAEEEVPESSDVVLNQALAEFEAGNAPGAISRLEALLESGSANDSAVAVLGAIYLETGNAAAAAATLEPLAEGQNPDPAVLYNYGRAVAALGNAKLAERSLERSVNLAPGSPASRELGFLRIAQGDYFAAYLLLRAWVLNHREDTRARLAAALCAVELERPTDASRLRLLSDLPQENPLVKLLWARTQLMKEDPWGAIALLRPLVADAPADLRIDMRRVLAEALLATDNGQSTIELLEGRLENEPALATLLARAQELVGDRTVALETLRPFTEPMAGSDPATLSDSARAVQGEMLSLYGELLAKAGDLEAGLPSLERAARLEPLNPDRW